MDVLKKGRDLIRMRRPAKAVKTLCRLTPKFQEGPLTT